ncbi:cupin domain-containing protein [Evansella sp. AB-rgal1]|uniref:cupin domain-containing protein n=1 Tax=Evansella sp. AB-rgal1 TaxID=3242696 RepID=UPI00359F0998
MLDIKQKDNRSITHTFTGEKITFLETSKETNGAFEYIEVFLPPGGEGPGLHYHMNFKESFEVIDGELKILYGKEEKVLQIGETLHVAKGEHHTFLNASNEKAVTFRVKITPANQFEESMRILYGLMEDGKTDNKGLPKDKIHGALILDMQDTRLVKMPFLIKILLNHLVKKGKKKGIDKELLRRYT